MELKSLKYSYALLATILLQFSCSKDVEITENKSDNLTVLHARSELELAKETQKVYHFIRFDIKNASEYNLFITDLKEIVSAEKGKLLSLGNPENCLERDCKNMNIVIEFESSEAGMSFFKKYKTLQSLTDRATNNLNYHAGAAFGSPQVFQNSIDGVYYFIGSGDLINLQQYITQYGPNAIGLIARDGGALLSADFRTPQCLLGDCFGFSVLIKFPSKQAAESWYNTPEYQALIPIRKEATKGGGLLLTPKN